MITIPNVIAVSQNGSWNGGIRDIMDGLADIAGDNNSIGASNIIDI